MIVASICVVTSEPDYFLEMTHARIALLRLEQIELRLSVKRRASRSAIAHVGEFAAEEEVVARRRKEIDHLGIFAEPSLVLGTSRNDHDVALAADPLFAAEAELHLALEHPHYLLISVVAASDIDASTDARLPEGLAL